MTNDVEIEIDEVENALAVLVGLPLWKVTRAGAMASLQFGARQLVPCVDGGTKSVGDWSLHLSCAWRIRERDRIIVASSDYYMRADHLIESTEEFDNDVIGANQLDQRIDAFMQGKEDSLVVMKIAVSKFADFRLQFASCRLEIFADFSVEDVECWRLFRPGQDSPHFVVSSQGFIF